MHPDTGPLERNIRPRPSPLAHRINNGILQLQCTEVRMRNRRMPATEIAGKRRPRSQVSRPIDPPHSRIEALSIRDFKPAELEEYPIGDARFETSTVRGAQPPGERDACGALLGVLCPERRQLASQQIGQPSRRARKELLGFRVQVDPILALSPAPYGSSPSIADLLITIDRATSSSARCTSRARAMTCRAQSPTA